MFTAWSQAVLLDVSKIVAELIITDAYKENYYNEFCSRCDFQVLIEMSVSGTFSLKF